MKTCVLSSNAAVGKKENPQIRLYTLSVIPFFPFNKPLFLLKLKATTKH